jgi:hypothetical protein
MLTKIGVGTLLATALLGGEMKISKKMGDAQRDGSLQRRGNEWLDTWR